MTIADTQRLAVVGDSITAGYGVALAESWAFRMESRRPEANVMLLGTYGATVRRWLQGYLNALDVLPLWRPTMVMIALGGNEWLIDRPPGEYADHLRQLITYIRGRVPSARLSCLHYYRIIGGRSPTGCDAQPGDPTGCIHQASTWEQYGQAMRATAEANGARYLDIAATRNWAPYQFDQAHLTPAGHQLLEQDIYAALVALP